MGMISSLPHPSPSEAVRRGGIGVMSAGELALSFTDCSTLRSGPCTCLGSTLELNLVEGVQVI